MGDDEFNVGSGNWWDTSRNRFDGGGGGGTTPALIPATLNAVASFGGWPAASEMKSNNMDDGSSAINNNNNPNQMMGLGLSSHWNQPPAPLFSRGEKSDNSFRSLVQEDLSSNSFQSQAASQEGWRQKIYSGSCEDSSSVVHIDLKRGGLMSLDHQSSTQFSSCQAASSNDSTITSQHNLDHSYGLILVPENQQHSYQNRSSSITTTYPYHHSNNAADQFMNKYDHPQHYLRTSSPPPSSSSSSYLHFSNNSSTPFWNNNTSTPLNHAPSTFFPTPLQTHNIPTFDQKPKNMSDARDFVAKPRKNNTEVSNKRPRIESPSPSPAFKVRKEKMGDRITALQQLVSPFGKTDTASVLSEAIECIKFLHGQLSVLSSPYMENGAPLQHHQNSNKPNDQEGPRQDLRSRGLCLVPIASTFPMNHDTTGDFWTPTFGGTTFR